VSRPARPADVDDICASLPETWKGTTWGDVPTWLVPSKVSERGKGSGFLLYRKPGPTAIDPSTGERFTDLLVISVADEGDKLALVEGDGPFFTIPHFDGYNAVLVQLSRLGEITRDELAEVISDAWRTCMPPGRLKKLDAAGSAGD
jgi:hypothetical protein